MTRTQLHGFVLRGVRALDSHGYFSDPVDVAVRGQHIAAVATNLPRSALSCDIDAEGLWLMPGVFDCHAHVTFATYDPFELVVRSLSERILETAAILRRTLAGGVTFVRDAGGADAGIRAALEAGHISGPRLAVSVVGLSRTAGLGDGNLSGPGLEAPVEVTVPTYPGRPSHLVGPGGVRHAVRELVRAGADWVHLFGSGGIMSARPGDPDLEFSADDLAAAVHEASTYGRGVMVQALGARAVAAAAQAGARSVEHGIGLTEREAGLLAAKGVTLVPTLSIYNELGRRAERGELPPWAADRARTTVAALGDTIAIARDAGVSIALGSDFGDRDQHGANLAEISYLHRAGLTAAESLLAATVNGARLCGVEDRLGRIAPGYLFDALLLDQDPGDLTLFERPGCVTGVFLGGVPVLPHARIPATALRAWAAGGAAPASATASRVRAVDDAASAGAEGAGVALD
ncbi:amidohydrolase family protein [Dactylosporangium fulvum]|uniref:Amidohydrolase family protein n=1 Tax=Dactylosporangium fulvum TaxID=53359 RepID=A0ABY5W964_9ACTN|nr:amidohydrolase family protein [Dactylosporangium fulvum]UWP86590.1 amidohydrolase family protein [Dactylosporangium fulvum]